jgi:hypothetical protein
MSKRECGILFDDSRVAIGKIDHYTVAVDQGSLLAD